MKRAFRILLLLLAALTALCVTASAATVYDVTAYKAVFKDCKIVPYTASGEAVAATASVTTTDGTPLTDADGNTLPRMIFQDVEKLTFTCTPATQGEEMIVFLLNKATATVPTADNICYLDQKTVSGQMKFSIYPSELEPGEYGIYVSSASIGFKEVGNIKVSGSFTVLNFMLGDVNDDKDVNITDVVEMLCQIVGKGSEWTETQIQAGDVDCNGSLNITDVVYVLNYIVGNIVSF